ncbi:hypothetical protein POM88_003326 [Heracleum sosnowskyi]|uniref:Uncharacterized protein n=1 Tax=Heracleum sosnowskyi TaxID=360622 RepID=A0AAD8JJD4_9APIA|nr:hypothetical protein POM88_003326 [Heracleum sosnowskyi]
MASATTLLRRSSAGVMGCGRQVYCRYLFGAAKRSHFVIPTSISSIRQFASSSPPPKYDAAFVKNLLSKLHDLERDIETHRKERELLLKSKEEEVGFVKRKHPILKEIESEMSKTKFNEKDNKFISGFEIRSDSSWRSTVNLEGSFWDELICLQISKPSCGLMPLTVEVGFPGVFGKQIEFRCTATPDGCCKIDKIKYRTFHKGVVFESSACVIGRGTRFYCRYTVAASHVVATSMSSVGQISAAPLSRCNEQTDIRDLISRVQSLKEEVGRLRNDREEFVLRNKEKFKVFKGKDPSLREVESELSNVIHAKKLPDDFVILYDSSWGFAVILRGLARKNEVIDILIKKPDSRGVPLVITIYVGSCNILPSKVEFHGTATADGYKIDKVNAGGFFSKGVAFNSLPENVQQEFYRYLELWGVNSSTTSNMYEYMLEKVKWKHLRGFHRRLKNMAEAA